MATASEQSVLIPEWANGPDGSGNGGWSAGLVAGHVAKADAGVVVNLRVPPPIGRELRVTDGVDGGVELRDGDVLVADAAPTTVAFQVPEAVRALEPEQAGAASGGFPFRDAHPFPRCLVCGTARDAALPAFGLHCGPVEGVQVDGERVFADRWRPGSALADPAAAALVAPAATWAALDCPSAAPVADPDGAPIVLARFAVRIHRRPRRTDEHVVAAWKRSSEGRKHVTRSVLLGPGGELLAQAEALWIEVRPR